ncbi:M4 family metallopeptidase [Actinokineospora auranticolor]|uniref:Thermolysin metallopeptidase-like protein n=1 Tax=Actinokineospora auranticolor TaxID=155976 RepID=A0A2S6GPS2_9PSEU|nr:M4 family metallopeptidase [Actinokineospora auranticolor]PPK67170.1 thermolysin metallopeptidase-like protein [Actinokineospora auranticolor]
MRRTIQALTTLTLLGTLLTPASAATAVVGTGTGHWNDNPLPLDTYENQGTYYLRDLGNPGLSCSDATNRTQFSGPDNDWGNGVARDRETGCVDALYAAQNFFRMTRNWLRRSPSGRPVLALTVGRDVLGVGVGTGTDITVGHNSRGEWAGTLDLVARPYARALDEQTPGGVSQNGTAEFIADAFATAAEWYANESPAGDAPDFLIGERTDLMGTGPLRDMANPAATWGKNCYDNTVPRGEPFASAGVGDHWFTLVAAGSAASSTCNGTTITGVGVQKAITVLYTAMLFKTSGSSYPKYRQWTLMAAKNLTPGDCATFTTVKAAWDAVTVPANPGDPTC